MRYFSKLEKFVHFHLVLIEFVLFLNRLGANFPQQSNKYMFNCTKQPHCSLILIVINTALIVE